MSSLREIVPEVTLDIADNVVVIELVCTDAYAARLLFEDIAERINGDGLLLKLRGMRKTGEAAE